MGGGAAGRIAWWGALIGLALNNLAIMGLHSVAGSVALNTISAGAVCTQVFAVVITLLVSPSYSSDVHSLMAMS